MNRDTILKLIEKAQAKADKAMARGQVAAAVKHQATVGFWLEELDKARA